MTDAFIWSWGYAMAVARSQARIEQRRYRVLGYRTGVPSRPWGYSVEVAR